MWTKMGLNQSSERLFYGTLTFIWLEYLWELYLTIRQRRVYKMAKEVPSELKEVLDAATYTKARLYGLDKNTFKIIKDLYELALTTVIFMFGMYLRFWHYSESILSHFGYDTSNEIVRSIVFYLIMNTTNTIITLPLSIYYTFFLEEAHGFNRLTAGLYVKETIKFYVISQLLTIPLIVSVIYTVRMGGTMFFTLTWLAIFIMSVFLVTIYPACIAPLFETLKPLPEGELKTQIKNMAARVEFPLAEIFVAEHSKRTSHSKMYTFGMFEKRIVLFDSLLEDYSSNDDGAKSTRGCTNDEVLALLAHKLGHWKHQHALKNFVAVQANMLLVSSVFGYMHKYAPMYRAFSFQNDQPVLIGLLIVSYFVYTPYLVPYTLLVNVMTTAFEFEADNFAKLLGKARHLRVAITKILEDDLEFPVYDRLYSTWHLSHPPLLERIAALDKTK